MNDDDDDSNADFLFDLIKTLIALFFFILFLVVMGIVVWGLIA